MLFKYTGPSSLADALVPRIMDEAVHATCRDLVRTAQDIMHATASAATPYKTGALRESWLVMPPERIAGGYSGTVSNSHWLAFIANYGSQPHSIEPDAPHKAIETPEGPRRRVIHHPGTQPHWMVERALDTVDAVMGWAGEHDLRSFARTWEAAILSESGKIR